LALAALPPVAAVAEPTFRLYGAEDCAPCLAFKRDHLAGIRAIGRDAGFAVELHDIPHLRDMGRPGIYGPADPVLRAALGPLGRAFPPVFLVTDGDRVLSVHGPDWGAALLAARDAR
jgi:hypothetical protein